MSRFIPYTTDYSGRQVDLELLQSIAKPVAIEQVTLSSMTKPAKIVAGLQKLAQRYAALLLSVIGDTHFDSANGSELMKQLLGGRIQDTGRLQNIFGLSNMQVIRQLRSDDAQVAVFGTQPTDEQIANAVLLDARVDFPTSTVYLRIRIDTVAGTSMTFVVPATAPR